MDLGYTLYGPGRLYHFSTRGKQLFLRAAELTQKTVYFKKVKHFLQQSRDLCHGLPEAEFLLHHDDHPKVQPNSFILSVNLTCMVPKVPHQDAMPMMAPITDSLHADIAFPYMYTYKPTEVAGRSTWGKPVPSALEGCPEWNYRKSKVFFRGGCTGPNHGYQGPLWRFYTRQRFRWRVHTFAFDAIDSHLSHSALQSTGKEVP